MKILVTGGAGFLGGHLVPKLVASGHEVIALTRSDKDSANLTAQGATPIMGDLEASELLRLPAIDAVVHAAAYSPARARLISRPMSQAPKHSCARRNGRVPRPSSISARQA